MKTTCIGTALFPVFLWISSASAACVDPVGDADQNPPPSPDGHGIVHEPDDPPGFDLRQVGGSVFWTHVLSPDIQADSLAVVLEIVVVGLIDQNFGSIDNRLFLNGTEVPGAFDNSHDGWNLYRFVPDSDQLLGDTLYVELRADPAEG